MKQLHTNAHTQKRKESKKKKIVVFLFYSFGFEMRTDACASKAISRTGFSSFTIQSFQLWFIPLARLFFFYKFLTLFTKNLIRFGEWQSNFCLGPSFHRIKLIEVQENVIWPISLFNTGNNKFEPSPRPITSTCDDRWLPNGKNNRPISRFFFVRSDTSQWDLWQRSLRFSTSLIGW